MSDRPTSREEYTTTGSGSADRRGDGLDLGGPVGNSGGYGSRPGLRRRGGRGWLWLVLILIVINAVSEGVTFADIKQFVSEQIREIDPDEIKEGAGELARSARENIDLDKETKKMKELGVLFHSLKTKENLDEASSAYKDIDEVMEQQMDLVKQIVKLMPLASIKG